MELFEKAIWNLISSADPSLAEVPLEIPPDLSLGDYALPCFRYAQQKKDSPQRIAESLNKKIDVSGEPLIERIEVMGGYLNFFVNRDRFANETVKSALKEGFGTGKEDEKVMVEYSQVNTHKAFHVGHLRGTLLGSSLIKLLRFAGFTVISANYQGDIGAHVAKCIWYLTKHHKGEYPKSKRGRWLGQIYQKANAMIGNATGEKQEKYKKEVSVVLQKLESGDSELTKLWKQTRQWSLDDFEDLYKLIGVKFDVYFFESQMEKPGKDIVESLKEKGLAETSEGALVIDLEKYKLGTWLLLKSDGTALYSTKDLALAKVKFEEYKIDRSVYVVGSEQKLYFQQLFKTLELMGFKQAKKCYHLPYDLVMLEGGKISSREGELILAEDFVGDVIETAAKEVKKRHEDWGEEQVEKAARSIALAGIKFSMLSIDSYKSMIFNLEKALDFEGETGPYLQYAHARICSIEEKYNEMHGKDFKPANKISCHHESEFKLARMISAFPGTVRAAASGYRPQNIANYLIALAQTFSEFYHACPVLKEKDEVMKARMTLCVATRKVLADGLGLMGIDAPRKM